MQTENPTTMKELIEKLRQAQEAIDTMRCEHWNVDLTKSDIEAILPNLNSLQSKGKASAEEFLRDKYKLVDFHDLTLNGKPWVELMEEYAQSHANKDGGVTKEDFANELDKHFKNRPDLNKEFDRIDSLIASIRICVRPIRGHNDPKSINDCFEELEYYSKLLRSRTTLPPKPQI